MEAMLKELQRKMAIYKMDTMDTRHLIDNIIREARREGAAIPTVEVDVIDQGKLHLIEYMVRGGCKRAYAVALVYGLVAVAKEEERDKIRKSAVAYSVRADQFASTADEKECEYHIPSAVLSPAPKEKP
jgi:hypothetical protein